MVITKIIAVVLDMMVILWSPGSLSLPALLLRQLSIGMGLVSYSAVFCLWGEMALEVLTQWGSREPTGVGGSLKRRECKGMTGIAEGM